MVNFKEKQIRLVDTELAKKANNVDIQNLDDELANKLDKTTLSRLHKNEMV